jgi:hypothetical protein
MIGTALPMALRWKWLLAAQGMIDRFWWLTRAYFVSYTAGQILPTSIGGDAGEDLRDIEAPSGTVGRRHRDRAHRTWRRRRGDRLLGAVGFVLAIGHYDVNAYLWLEGAFVFGRSC